MSEQRLILIVDDSAEDRELYRRLLNQDKGHSYRIMETESGEHGLELCDSQEPNCVLLDYNLPDLDGLEFLAELTGPMRVNPPAVVMLTGTGNETIAVEAMKKGAQDYLVKGNFSRNDFQRALDNAIGIRSLEHALEQRGEELNRSNEELTQFAFAASHDLQAPLRRIQSFSQLLQQGYQGKLDQEADEFIGYIVDSTPQMQALVDGLLEFSRAGTKEKRREPTDCSAAVDEALANLDIEIKESNSTVKRDDLPTVSADRVQLIQLFQNLIGNAIKYHGDLAPEVRISAVEQDDCTQFNVCDNGIGIAPKYADQIFDIFKRLHSDDDYRGTGIGLATCKKIVERHGGRIWVESTLGQGSVFCFTIPHGD